MSRTHCRKSHWSERRLACSAKGADRDHVSSDRIRIVGNSPAVGVWPGSSLTFHEPGGIPCVSRGPVDWQTSGVFGDGGVVRHPCKCRKPTRFALAGELCKRDSSPSVRIRAGTHSKPDNSLTPLVCRESGMASDGPSVQNQCQSICRARKNPHGTDPLDVLGDQSRSTQKPAQ